MDLLQPLFDMWLEMLGIFINDSYFVGISWIVILTMAVLIFWKLLREVKACKPF